MVPTVWASAPRMAVTTDTGTRRRRRAEPTPDAPPPRRARGFEAAGGLVRGPVAHAAEGRGFAVSRLLTDWADIVGPELAAMARPVQITHGRGGRGRDASRGGGAVLTLLCSGAAAPLVQMQAETIRRHVNACHGHDAVARIRLTQTAPGEIAPPGLAEQAAGFVAAPPPPCDNPRTRLADAMARDIGDSDLRAALATLARNVLSRSH